MSCKISIIVPVYNVENYLQRCLNSLLAQTYDNYEIILVNDGSTDNSGRMCDDYAKKHSNVRVYHQKNQGQSAARNFGVQVARGTFIAFVDSDDLVTEDYLSYLYSMIKEFEVDVAGAKMQWIKNSVNVNMAIKPHTEQSLETGESLKKMCYGDSIGVSACAKLYKKELLEKNPYPVGRFHEDVDTTYKIISSCKKMAVGNKVIYYYFQREGSTMHQSLTEQQFYGMEAASNLLKYMQTNFPQVEQAARIRCAMKAQEYIPMLLASSGDQKNNYKRIRAFLKPHMKAVLKDTFVSNYFKGRCIIIMLGYYPVKTLWPMAERGRNLVLNVKKRQ